MFGTSLNQPVTEYAPVWDTCEEKIESGNFGGDAKFMHQPSAHDESNVRDKPTVARTAETSFIPAISRASNSSPQPHKICHNQKGARVYREMEADD